MLFCIGYFFGLWVRLDLSGNVFFCVLFSYLIMIFLLFIYFIVAFDVIDLPARFSDLLLKFYLLDLMYLLFV